MNINAPHTAMVSKQRGLGPRDPVTYEVMFHDPAGERMGALSFSDRAKLDEFLTAIGIGAIRVADLTNGA